MAHEAVTTVNKRVNFLDSAQGIVLKTCTVYATGVSADEHGYKIVKAGTVYPANDETATGILYEDVDVTEGDHEASLIVAGRVLKDCLPEELDEDAETALKALGFFFAELEPAIRPEEESYTSPGGGDEDDDDDGEEDPPGGGSGGDNDGEEDPPGGGGSGGSLEET